MDVATLLEGELQRRDDAAEVISTNARLDFMITTSEDANTIADDTIDDSINHVDHTPLTVPSARRGRRGGRRHRPLE